MHKKTAMDYQPVNGEMVLTEVAPKQIHKKVHQEEKEIYYPHYGVIPPIGGIGTEIRFKTTDPQSYSTIIDLGRASHVLKKEVDRLRAENKRLQDHVNFLNNQSQSTTNLVDKADLKKEQRILFLEAIIEELIANILILIPISLQTSDGTGVDPLKLENVSEYWCLRAKLPYVEGKIQPKRYYRDKGSF